jgi:hypothetical protein
MPKRDRRLKEEIKKYLKHKKKKIIIINAKKQTEV